PEQRQSACLDNDSIQAGALAFYHHILWERRAAFLRSSAKKRKVALLHCCHMGCSMLVEIEQFKAIRIQRGMLYFCEEASHL
ncbi:MAG: hypothetical protein J2P36_12775, partial [Ktedonobacteraceae bacterium]|nr:hypothetical protein [Ktedonobacteraceae bacterium]